VETDTIYRIFSMTKPVTSVAAMMLYEEGCFRLSDPVADYLPEFSDSRVYVSGSALAPLTRPAAEPMRIWHLFTHTAGLTYGFLHQSVVDALYRRAGFEWGCPAGFDLAASCTAWAGLPLLFDPGSSWNYSVATDVLGRLVELWSGMSLDAFFSQRIFGPLQMDETGFSVAPEHLERLAVLYGPAADGSIHPLADMAELGRRPPAVLMGGAGLVSTIGDYRRFAEMLLRRGELEGTRLLGARTVSYMGENHLPGGRDIAFFGHPISGEPDPGVGFGLGLSVVVDPARHRVVSSDGELGWGGAASTTFFLDPCEDLVVVWMTQLLPSSTIPVKARLQPLVYQAIVD
ncbi:MAG: serine hydrolase domain-containing protein, partial [Acidimicrobiales bacterium]